jgi:hypothetical protein
MAVGGKCHIPAALPPGKTRYPFYRRLSGAAGLVWIDAENLTPTGIRTRTIQAVTSRYTV